MNPMALPDRPLHSLSPVGHHSLPILYLIVSPDWTASAAPKGRSLNSTVPYDCLYRPEEQFPPGYFRRADGVGAGLDT
jgi:hypothetical protein